MDTKNKLKKIKLSRDVEKIKSFLYENFWKMFHSEFFFKMLNEKFPKHNIKLIIKDEMLKEIIFDDTIIIIITNN
jgi:hypothetical protein